MSDLKKAECARCFMKNPGQMNCSCGEPIKEIDETEPMFPTELGYEISLLELRETINVGGERYMGQKWSMNASHSAYELRWPVVCNSKNCHYHDSLPISWTAQIENKRVRCFQCNRTHFNWKPGLAHYLMTELYKAGGNY